MASNTGAKTAHIVNSAIAANTRCSSSRLVFDTVPRTCIAAPSPDLKVESDGRGHCARRNVMRSAEGGEEVVKRLFVRHVHNRNACAPLLLLAVKKVLVSQGTVKQIAGCD